MPKPLLLSAALAGLLAAAPAANAQDERAGPDGRVSPRVVIQSADSFDIEDLASPFPVRGGGVITRRPGEVSAAVSLADLQPGAAYSLWWVIYNRPEACATAPCSVPDIIAGVGQVFHAGAGVIASPDGTANTVVRLDVGGVPTGADRFSAALPGVIDPASETGLQFPFGAEIGIVARNHGPAATGATGAQLGRYYGGCTATGGPFDCFDQQIMTFPAAR